MKRTDIDVWQLNKCLSGITESQITPMRFENSDSYYRNIESEKRRGIYEYSFENASEFKSLLENIWNANGNRELLPLTTACTASAFRFCQEKHSSSEERKVTDFIYEF